MEFKELPDRADQLGDRAEDCIRVSHQIGPAAEFIARHIHDAEMLMAGEKWTLVMALQCGFHIELEMRVHHLGSCAKKHTTYDGPASERSVMFGVRNDGLKLPFPALLKPHKLLGPPEKG